MHFEHEIKMSFKEIDEAKSQLAEIIESNEVLLK
jgi:regulator of replication initiation timing